MNPTNMYPESPEGPPEPSNARDVFDGPFVPNQIPIRPPQPDIVQDGVLDIPNNPQISYTEPATQLNQTATQWDHNKAETIATALQANPDTSEYFSSEPGTLGAVYAKSIVDAPKEEPTSPPELKDFTKEAIHQRFIGEVDKATQPFEELYDTNPELFASMPTGEFVEKVRLLQELIDGINDAQVFIDNIEESYDQKYLDEVAAGQQEIIKSQLDNIVKTIGVEQLPESDRQSIKEQFIAFLDPWEHPGRLVAEKLKELILFVHDRQLKHRDSLIAQKEVFLNQYNHGKSEQPLTTFSQRVGNDGYVHTTVDPTTSEVTDVRFPDEHEG